MFTPSLFHVRNTGTSAYLIDTGIDAVVRSFEVLVPRLGGPQVKLCHPDQGHRQVAFPLYLFFIIIAQQVGIDVLHQPVAAPVLVHVRLQRLEVRPELLTFPRRDDFRVFHFVRLVHNRPPPVKPVGSDAGVETGFPVQVQL